MVMSTLKDRERIVRRASLRRVKIILALAVMMSIVVGVLASEIFMEFGIASRLWWSPAEMAQRHADRIMLGHVTFTRFIVACPNPGISDADMQRFQAYADARGWNQYPQGGANCRDP